MEGPGYNPAILHLPFPNAGHWSPHLPASLQTWAWGTVRSFSAGSDEVWSSISSLPPAQVGYPTLVSSHFAPTMFTPLPLSSHTTIHTPPTWLCSCPHCFGKNHSEISSSQVRNRAKTIPLSPLPSLSNMSPHSTLWPRLSHSDMLCLTTCSLCLYYLLPPTRMGSLLSLPGRIWLMHSIQRVPQMGPTLLYASWKLLSSWFKLEDEGKEGGKLL